MALYSVKTLPGEAISTRIANAFVRFAYGLIDARNARLTRSALHELSDEMLDDIGLTRADIPRAARGLI